MTPPAKAELGNGVQQHLLQVSVRWRHLGSGEQSDLVHGGGSDDDGDSPPSGGSNRPPAGLMSPMTPVLRALRSKMDLQKYVREGSIRGSVFNLCSATLGAGISPCLLLILEA